MSSRCKREVIELHQFFQDWFNGSLERSDVAFKRLTSVLNPAFCLIPPSGEIVERAELLQRLTDAYGSSASAEHDNKIWIEDFNVRYQDNYVLLATYQEWQEHEGNLNGRISTVLFRINTDTPNGVEWLHVHETSMRG